MILRNSQLKEYLSRTFSGKEIKQLLAAPPEPQSLRINMLKADIASQKIKLVNWGVQFEEIPYITNAVKIVQDPLPVSQTLDHFLGKFQYQGLSSQLPVLALNPRPGETILDMAAAPGSKSTQLAALMENRGQLFLNDINRFRLQALNANLQRAGVLNQVILNLPGERLGQLLPNYFDRVLLDAPCTALGSIHQSTEIDLWWSYGKLDKLSSLQYRMLISAFKALKPGGVLVYSTCSITPEENEQNIEKLIADYPVQVEDINHFPPDRFATGCTDPVRQAVRVYPHQHGMEGFFLVKLRKLQSQKHVIDFKKTTFVPVSGANDKEVLPELEEIKRRWEVPLSAFAGYHFFLTKSRLWMMSADIEQLPQSGFTSAGMLLAERKASSWKLLNPSVQHFRLISKNAVELDLAQIKQLFCEKTLSGVEASNGYHTLIFRGESIGSVYCHNGSLKIRLPHSYRLPELA